MKNLILFLKGLVIGIGKIIPGVSGSILAISLGIYEECINKLENFWHDFKTSFCYLTPIATGICLSVLFGSKILLHFLNTYYLFTVAFFLGLIIGTVPGIVKKQKMTFKDWLIIIFIVGFIFYLTQKIKLPTFIPSHNLFSYLYIIFLGFIDAITTILPGISGTATFMMLGSYEFILTLFSNPFSNLFFCILFAIGLCIGIFIMIKIVHYCFEKKSHQTWICIIGFLLSSIFFLFLKIIDLLNQSNIFFVFLLFIIGYSIISMFDQE